MARKSSENKTPPTNAAPSPLIVQNFSRHGQRRNTPQLDHSSNAHTDSTKHMHINNGKAGADRARSCSSDEEADGDISGADNGESEEESDEDEDYDALAPSDRAMGAHGGRAGLTGRSLVKTDILQDETENTSPAFLKSTDSSGRNSKSQNEEGDSDDEVYNAVDLIGCSDEEEPDVEISEERNIIESEEDGEFPPLFPGRAGEASDIWEGFDLGDGLFSSDVHYFDEQYGRTEPSILESEMELFRGINVFDGFDPLPSLPPSPTPRRVHFKEPIFPPSDSSDIVSGDEDLNGLFNSAESTNIVVRNIEDDDDGSSMGHSSGYETDYGETTDEEDVPASATAQPQALLRRPSLSSVDFDAQVVPSAALSAASSPFKVHETLARPSRGPRMGTWTVNPGKPYAMIDSTGDNLILYPARRPANVHVSSGLLGNSMNSTANTSPLASQPISATVVEEEMDYSDFLSHVPADPMLASGPDVMSSAPPPSVPSHQSQDQNLASQNVFIPMDGLGSVRPTYEMDDEDDDEDLLRVEDFIDFGVDSSDGPSDEEIEVAPGACLPTPVSTSPTGTGTSAQPKLSSPGNLSENNLLQHFDKGVVSAFRRGQPHHQQYAHHPLAGQALNNHAFKGGRQAAANSPLSAQNKRKLDNTFGIHSSPGIATKRRSLHHR